MNLNRMAMALSLALVVAGVALLVYADPLARLSLASPTSSFTGSITNTFTGVRTFGNFTGSGSFTFRTGGLPGGGGSGVVVLGSTATDEQVESLVAIALIGVGLMLEVTTILLAQSQPTPTPAPVETE